jgi:type II secretory pathway component PulM
VDFVLVIAVLAAVVMVVSAPLRAARREEAGSGPELRELEAAREAKYREIRDAELDHRTGKLSDEDFQALDGSLRAEAIEILRAIDRLRADPGLPGSAD